MRLTALSALVALSTLALHVTASHQAYKSQSLNARHLLRTRDEATLTPDYERFADPETAKHSLIFGGDDNVSHEIKGKGGNGEPKKSLSLQSADDGTRTDAQPDEKSVAPKGKLPPMAKLPEKIFGVNLGAWFVLENWQGNSIFLTLDLVDQTLTDEYSWSIAVGKEEGAKRLKEWYATRYTEDDFKQIKAAGLNMVRIPVSHWMLNASDTEPYIGGIQLPFLKQGLKWAQKYNLSVMIDLHTAPGSQNGYDNSGKGSNGNLGQSIIEWHRNSTNFLRTLSALKTLTEEVVNTEEFGGIVKAIEVMNEPHTGKDAIPISLLALFFSESYNAIRSTVNSSAPVTPYVVFNIFQSPVNLDEPGGLNWDGESGWNTFFLSDAFQNGTFFLDTHQYQAWDGLLLHDDHIARACNKTASLEAQNAKIPTLVGEYSLGITVRCVNPTVPSYHSCQGLTIKDDLKTLSAPEQVLFAKRFYEAQRAAYGKTMGMIMWNWKTDSAAAWSY
ncbi:glycoside hydrolase [Ceraceosorus guamensis]|uniref:glucan 1,3-beta-glucosidase n=1 Tax=Ceraceosorus guamensis TaxID=1522189 RepID=A0A316W246_9BASI|nr:glycoside hydrolase [Ceraceosorus guamensis]PWN43936.1 glycoside hydrolase [Ceraceosorus guamensis]